MNVDIRYQNVKDAQIFFEILNNPNFLYWDSRPSSVQEEIKFLEKTLEKSKNNLEHNYTILFEGKIVGAVGIKINQHRNHLGEIGYFLDEKYWGKGIVVEAIRKAEQIAFNSLKLKRIEIIMMLENEASKRVAEKAGYERECISKKALKFKDEYCDAYIYFKTI